MTPPKFQRVVIATRYHRFFFRVDDISYFALCEEVMVLLWAEEEVLMEPGFQEEDEEDETGACIETEDDDDDEEEEFTLCELEPVAVVCILRLMVVYSLELERVALHARTRNFSRTQIEVLRRTLVAFTDCTIPSVSRIIESAFLDTQFLVLQGFSRSPAVALQEVRTRLSLFCLIYDKFCLFLFSMHTHQPTNSQYYSLTRHV